MSKNIMLWTTRLLSAIVGVALGIVAAPFLFLFLTLGLLITWIGCGVLCLVLPVYCGIEATKEVE